MTSKISAFDGRVVFHVRHMSLRTIFEADVYEAYYKEYYPLVGENRDMLPNVVSLSSSAVACTEAIEFDLDDDAPQQLRDLQAFWQAYEEAKPSQEKKAAAYCEWVLDATVALAAEWSLVVDQATKHYINPASAPLVALTLEQQEAARQPDSPLPDSVPSSDSTS